MNKQADRRVIRQRTSGGLVGACARVLTCLLMSVFDGGIAFSYASKMCVHGPALLSLCAETFDWTLEHSSFQLVSGRISKHADAHAHRTYKGSTALHHKYDTGETSSTLSHITPAVLALFSLQVFQGCPAMFAQPAPQLLRYVIARTCTPSCRMAPYHTRTTNLDATPDKQHTHFPARPPIRATHILPSLDGLLVSADFLLTSVLSLPFLCSLFPSQAL